MKQVVLIAAFIALVSGHARLRDPPARTSAYHLGFPNVPVEWSDFQMNCGGYDKKVALNGACGICGDAADAKPRESERPDGKCATNTIVRTYKSGTVIDVEIEMEANHKGSFWFRICPAPEPNVEVTQACLDKNTLEIVEAPDVPPVNKTMWNIPDKYKQGEAPKAIWKFKVQLPTGLKCDRCVMQWDWLCANRPGMKMQETFRGCADVKIE